ncbi:MAG: hypothetical protein U0527_05680 [Candidatus Eisenbacteria bacterium]
MALDHIGSKRLLLILDNCEHLTEARAAAVGKILSACQGVHLFGTSREALRAEGEGIFVLPPLSLGGSPASAFTPPPAGQTPPWSGPMASGGPSDDGDEVATREALDLFTRLAEKSLVVRDLVATGPGRYWLLESIREYAQEKLRAHPAEAEPPARRSPSR